MNELRASWHVRLLLAVEKVQRLSLAAEHEPKAKVWRKFFADEIDLVHRARNNLLYFDPISDKNLEAAAELAEKLLALADKAGVPEPTEERPA